MSENPGEPDSLVRRGCFVSGVIAVIAVIVLRQFVFRLPPLGMLIFAGLLWLGIFIAYMRRGYRGPQ